MHGAQDPVSWPLWQQRIRRSRGVDPRCEKYLRNDTRRWTRKPLVLCLFDVGIRRVSGGFGVELHVGRSGRRSSAAPERLFRRSVGLRNRNRRGLAHPSAAVRCCAFAIHYTDPGPSLVEIPISANRCVGRPRIRQGDSATGTPNGAAKSGTWITRHARSLAPSITSRKMSGSTQSQPLARAGHSPRAWGIRRKDA